MNVKLGEIIIKTNYWKVKDATVRKTKTRLNFTTKLTNLKLSILKIGFVNNWWLLIRVYVVAQTSFLKYIILSTSVLAGALMTLITW